MVGKFSNTISKVSNNGNNNSNSNSRNNSILRGIPVIEISTPQYVLKKEVLIVNWIFPISLKLLLLLYILYLNLLH